MSSAGQGPAECRAFAAFVRRRILKEAAEAGFAVVSDDPVPAEGGLRSARIRMEVTKEDAEARWIGSWQWICRSPFRPHHARRNWFVTVSLVADGAEVQTKGAVSVSVCRSRGRGGQNVNRRNTAVRVRHVPTGISVRIENERSQHLNRLKALEVLKNKIRTAAASEALQSEEVSHAQLYRVERGNAVRVFRGMTYEEQMRHKMMDV